MFATTLVVLALASALASTRVECAPYLNESAVPGRHRAGHHPGPLSHIFLGATACGALLYTSASNRARAAIRRLNPRVDFDQLVGVGLQVTLHESEHVALQSRDECVVEKTARAKIDGLIAQLGDSERVAQEEAVATASDASLPGPYHAC
jgi:hypothetical protein